MGFDRVVTRHHHGPVVVPVLPGKEEGLRVPITLGGLVTVVTVRGDEVVAKTSIRLELDGKGVVVPKEQAFSVATLQ